ncbi:uncharacterized protein LOC115406848 isoform X3 [Salarias fasciatus]|uniref:uncharacterized protein LOC115406848 isoform X3 n=1 Tax=Salarias fasciatus TaxID=181472 RepID=UPI001176FFB7|nr:uncharacterized protein LOC115406848 isoform X3 [Salarias fasciatus]
MFVIFGFLLMIAVGCCINDQNFEIKSVVPQQNVTLTCPRTFTYKENMYWIRIISGHHPEFLGKTIGFDSSEVHQTSRFTTKQGPGTFVLHINQTQMTDTGLYYCIQTSWTNLTFLRRVFLKVQDSTDDQTFETKSVAAQQHATLECPREKLLNSDKLYWIRIISGHQPELLGRTTVLDDERVHKTPHFTTKQENEIFILHIHQTQINDTGLYYCIRTSWDSITFLRGVFLNVEGPQSSISGIIQAPPSAAVHPGESVSLQCSVLSDSEKKTCSEDYRVHWFRAGSHQSHPSFIYTHGNNAGCGKSSQKCFYSFSKKVNVSDAGTYYCAVAACGEVMFGNGAKLDIKYGAKLDREANTALYSLGAAFVATMIVSVCLIWTNEKKDCNDMKTVVMYSRMSKTASKTRQQ